MNAVQRALLNEVIHQLDLAWDASVLAQPRRSREFIEEAKDLLHEIRKQGDQHGHGNENLHCV